MNMLPDSAYGRQSYDIEKMGNSVIKFFLRTLAIIALVVAGVLAYFSFQGFNPDSSVVSFYESQAIVIIMFGLFSIAFLGAAIWIIFYSKIKISDFDAEVVAYHDAVEYKEHARVASKVIQHLEGKPSEFHVVFDFICGQRKSFTVKVQQCKILVEGDVGELIYKQNGEYLYFGQFTQQQPSALSPAPHSRQQW